MLHDWPELPLRWMGSKQRVQASTPAAIQSTPIAAATIAAAAVAAAAVAAAARSAIRLLH